MRPVEVTLSAQGLSQPIPVDYLQDSFKLGLIATLSDGANLTYSIQNSADDPFAEYATDYNTDADWFDTVGLTGNVANAQGNIFFPVRAVRLNVTTHVSGSIKLVVLQPTEN